MNTNNPHVAFIGSKEVGKTSTIKHIWPLYSSDMFISISEEIEGRGLINYDIIELPYIPLSIASETEEWILAHKDILYNIDVLVYIIESNDITYTKKAKFLYRLQEEGIIRRGIHIIIAMSQIEYAVDIEELNNNYVIGLNDVSNVISLYQSVLSVFRNYTDCVQNELTVIPYSHNANWQVQDLKKLIISGIIDRQNQIVFNPNSKTIVFVGKTGCGKSSTINHICGTNLPVDGSVACTKYPIVINKNIEINGKSINVNIVDLPGIAESLEANIIYNGYYNKYIKKATSIVCLSQANTRAYTQDEIFYKSLIASGILDNSKNIVLGINKIDLIFKTEEHLSGIDLSTTTDEDPLIVDKINDYYNNVFASIFATFPNVSRQSVVVYSIYQNWNINKLTCQIFKDF